MFGVTRGAQDVSFESMRAHHKAVVAILAKQPEVEESGSFVVPAATRVSSL